MTTALPAMPDAPDPRRDARTAAHVAVAFAYASLLGLGLYHLIRTWLGPLAH